MPMPNQSPEPIGVSARISVSIIVVLLGVVVFQAFRIRDLNIRIASSSSQAEVASRPSSVNSPEQKALSTEFEAAINENLRRRRTAESGQTSADGIAGRVATLKDVLKRLPEQRIPQLTYATEADWYAAVDGPLETAEDFRVALARLRASGETRFAKNLQPALRAYMDANGGAFPKEVLQLQSFFTEPVEPEMLQHYKIVRAAEINSVRVGGEWAITQASVIDSEFDLHVVIGPHGFGSYGGPRR